VILELGGVIEGLGVVRVGAALQQQADDVRRVGAHRGVEGGEALSALVRVGPGVEQEAHDGRRIAEAGPRGIEERREVSSRVASGGATRVGGE